MPKRLLSVYSFFLLPMVVLAQVPVASFDVNATLCKQQQVLFENNTAGADQYQWDFCLEDFLEIQSTNPALATLTGFNGGYGYKLIEDGGQWFGFLTSRGNHKLYRLDFGNNPTHVPAVVDLGNPGGVLFQPEGIDIFQYEENWYGFVGSLAFSSPTQGVIRLDFGNSLQNDPVATNLGNFGFTTRFRDLKIVQQGSDLILLLVNYNNNSILRINYRDSFDNTISGSDITSTGTITNANLPVGLDIIQRGSSWIALLASFNNNEIIQLNFNSDFLSAPVVEAHYTFSGMTRPYKIKVSREGSKYYAIVSNESVPVTILDLKDLDPVNAPAKIDHSGLPVLLAIENVRINGKEILTGVPATGTNVSRVIFEADCGASVNYNDDETPTQIYYNNEGNYEIELTAINSSSGNKSVASEVVNVINSVSPDITFSFQEICANHDINLSSINQSGDINNYHWDFGDGATLSQSDATNPMHIYSSASIYYPSLTVTASNGCQNFARDTLKVYNPPVPGFTLPSGLVCTNSSIIFANTTTDNYDGNLQYEWHVQSSPVTNTRELEYSFTTTGDQTIKLTTSIPGCATEITQVLPSVQSGPQINFSIEGQCATDEVSFTTEVSETVTNHLWSFDDGTSSTEINPFHQFDFSGTYDVSLTATSLNGCNNSSTQQVTIFSKPSPDFSIQSPPLACDGVNTPFSDLTPDPPDSDITSWQWQFGESTETLSTQDAEFIFAGAGEYDVSLTVISDAGCEASVTKPVTIYPSPVAAISQTPPCLEKPATFTATGDAIQFYYWEIGTAYYEEDEIMHTFQNAGDHPLMLTVYGANNCVTTLNHTVNVPQTLTPDFSFINHCVGYETAFEDITEDEYDPITSREWNFSGALVEDSVSPTHVFNSVGEQNVSLTVTTGSGCIYATQQTVNVLARPVASFTASPETGAVPLEVQFTNTSTNASEWLWTFSDQTGTISTEQSPSHTFTEIGEYDVELLARNSAGCESRFGKIFSVETPLPDVNLKLISTSENPDGSIKVIITLENRGNTFIKNLPVEIDISGNTSLTEIVEDPIAPGSLYNLVLGYSINRVNNLSFLCADATLENDLAPDGNRMCVHFDQSIFIFHPYPNPAIDNVRFEWISPAESEIIVQVSDSFGKTLLYEKLTANVGLNQHQIDLSAFQPGVYFVILKEKTVVKTHRIVISGQN